MTIVRATSFGPLLRSCSKRPVPDPLELCTGMPALSNRSNVSCVILQAMGRLRSTIGLGVATLVLAGSAPASGSDAPPIGSHLTLTTQRAVAGQPIKGTVVLTNRTQHEITVDACAIDGWLAVGLSGRVNSSPFGNLLVRCAPSVRLAPGTNRFPVSVATTYAGCTQPQPGGTPPTVTPTCVIADGHLGPPPLPAGRYSTKLHLIGLTGLTQAPNRIVVTLEAPAHAPVLAPCAETTTTAPTMVTVPNVIGDSSSAAALVFAKACLNAGYADPVGTRVVAESPPPNSKVAEYSTVTLGTR